MYPGSGFRTGEGVIIRIASGRHEGLQWILDKSAGPAGFDGAVRTARRPDNYFIFSIDGQSSGAAIYFGSKVRIRHTRPSALGPWLLAAGNSNDIVAMNDGKTAWEGLFTVDYLPGEAPTSRGIRGGPRRIDYGTPFRLRIAQCSCWIGWDARGVELAPAFNGGDMAAFMVEPPPTPPVTPPQPSAPPPAPAPQPAPAPKRIAIPPTFRVQTTGSAIIIYATNSGNVPYACSLSYTYAHDSFGETKTGTVNSTFVVPGQTKDQITDRLTTTMVNVRPTSPIVPQCNAR